MTLSYHSYGDINVPDYREPLRTFISQQVVSLCSAFWNITRPQGYLLTNIATESQTSLWTLLEAYLFYPLTCPGFYGPWAHNPQIWRMSLLLVILILYCVDIGLGSLYKIIHNYSPLSFITPTLLQHWTQNLFCGRNWKKLLVLKDSILNRKTMTVSFFNTAYTPPPEFLRKQQIFHFLNKMGTLCLLRANQVGSLFFSVFTPKLY